MTGKYKDPEWLLDKLSTHSQTEVAQMCGVSQATISSWERKITTQTNKEHQCPSCPLSYDTRQGMLNHHATAHGESIRLISVKCDHCNGNAEKQPSDIEKTDGTYCCHECYIKDTKRPETKTRECERCEVTFDAQRHTSGYMKYCSDECRVNRVICAYCGQKFPRRPSHEMERNYCSQECMGKDRRELYCGENNPAWSGGAKSYYGNDWNRQRERVLERDGYVCQDCGSDSNLHVHHVIPLKKFEKPGSANYLDNLITLCPTCHAKWEGIPVKPQ